MSDRMSISGIDDVRDLLENIAPNHANNIMRSTIHGVAGDIRKDARSYAPEDDGDLDGAIKTKRRRSSFGSVRSDVVVERRAFYWRFLEYGQGPDNIEHAFFAGAVENFRRSSTAIFVSQFGKKFDAAIARARKRM